MSDKQMTPEQLIDWFSAELKRGRTVLIPKKILKDTITGLIAWKGFCKDDFSIVDKKIRSKGVVSKHSHVTLTLKKYVKQK